MHITSYDAMARFVADYLESRRGRRLEILDVASRDVNGSYRPLFGDPAWRYTGANLVLDESWSRPRPASNWRYKPPRVYRRLGCLSLSVSAQA